MSAPVVVFVVTVVVIALGAAWLVVRGRSVDSSVDSFRRQIDALGPEARRSVVDQVQQASDDGVPGDGGDDGA